MGLKAWLQTRKDLKATSYDAEEQRLQAMICELDPFDEKYDLLQSKLKNNLSMKETSRESRRKICKSDRGNLIRTILTVGGGLFGGFMIGKFEKDGMTFTGEKRSFMDSMTRTIGNIFFRN